MKTLEVIAKDEIFTISDDETMDIKHLNKYIAKHQQLNGSRYKKLKDGYEGFYPIMMYQDKPQYKPDNRIIVNFAKYIVDTFNGFFIGIPIKVSSTDEEVATYINELDKRNHQDDNNAEISKNCSIYGKCYEMYFINEDAKVGIRYIEPTKGFIVYDDSIVPEPRFFVTYYYDSNSIMHGYLSDDSYVYEFSNKSGMHFIGEGSLHGFDGVPVTEYVENAERMSAFESTWSMINAYNKAISEKANDVDYFADAYLKIIGAKVDKDGIIHIRNNRIINFDEDSNTVDVGFLEKPNADGSQENLINRLERLIFQMSMTPNINDENFGTSSGIALKYKLLSMSNLAKTKERKFTGALDRRYKLIFSNPINTIHEDKWVDITYKFSQNYPANVLEETQIAQNLEGIVSKDTQLSSLSIVEDVQEEKEKIKLEDEVSKESIVDKRMFNQ